MKKTKSLIALIVSLILLVGACSPAGTETTAQNAQTTTAAPETDEITTGRRLSPLSRRKHFLAKSPMKRCIPAVVTAQP